MVTDIFKRQVTVAHIFGIPVRFDYRWFIVFVLSVWLIAMNLSRGGMWVGSFKLMPVSVSVAWLLAVITTIGLFLSVLGHELSHALMGRAEGIEIEEIVLHPFGGLARLRNEPESPRAEFRIAVAGPAASFLFAAISFVLMLPAMMAGYTIVSGVLLLLCAGNLLLAVFNLFPGYPLDGGRVLRALLAIWMGNARATEVAAAIGQGFAVLFGIVGIFYNPMLLIIAVFIFLAASGEAAQAQLRAVAQGALVSDAMITKFASLGTSATVGDAVDALIRTTQTEFPIVDGSGHLRGVLTRDAMIKALKERGPDTPVLEVMQADIPTVPARAKLDMALRSLMERGRSVVGVTEVDGRLVGLLTVENLGEMMMVQAALPKTYQATEKFFR